MGGPPLQRIYDVAPFAVDFIDSDGPDLAIAFASVGHDSARAPSPEFVATASGQCRRRALFVSDASRSWANHPGFEAAVLTAVNWVAARAPLGRVATLGLSMGGFSALVAAQVVPVDAVLAFGPQYSVAPGFGEGRWSEWTKTLPPLRWPVAPLPRSGPMVTPVQAAPVASAAPPSTAPAPTAPPPLPAAPAPRVAAPKIDLAEIDRYLEGLGKL